MGRNNADFESQILIHRGLTVPPEQVNTDSLGESWTLDPEIAKTFAGESGSVVTGKVSVKDTVPSEWQTRKEAWTKDPTHFDPEDDYSGDDPEKEVTVHPEAKVTVTSIKKVKK